MPIVTLPAADEALAQGDILKDIPFVSVDAEGSAVVQNTRFVLVLSRNCNSIRDEQVIVAPVSTWALDLKAQLGQPETPSMDRVRRALSGVRDGGHLVDKFYLGCLEAGSSNRFAADLSQLATIKLPTQDPARASWVASHRVWWISSDFARDLHVRLFNCFAKMGFDDEAWFCDPDLDILVNEGQQQIAKAREEVLAAERAIQDKELRNETVSPKMREELARKQKSLATIEAELKTYSDEKTRRSTIAPR